MKGAIRATVKYGAMPQREKRFPAGTPARIIKAWKIHNLSIMMKRSPQRERGAKGGTLRKDAERYYPLIKVLTDWVTRRSEVRAWLRHLGDRPRHLIVKSDILRVQGIWRSEGRKAKTINNRVTALRDLYHKLDGDDAPTPCDGVKPLRPVKVPIQTIDVAVINRVIDTLETSTAMHAKQDRARLMVLATTGKRPIEVERAQPEDVDLHRRVWMTRDAKFGHCPGVYLNDEMLIAWRTFAEVNAWGTFPDHFPRRLRDAGWPKGIRPYNLRHTTWITASERGADLADIQAAAGHRNIATTRAHYVPVLQSRMQRMSESIDGRFGWEAGLADQGKPYEN
jgi:integrase